MTQERTPRAALDTKDNKDLTVPQYHHQENIIYFLVLHKPFMCENFNLQAKKLRRSRNFYVTIFDPSKNRKWHDELHT